MDIDLFTGLRPHAAGPLSLKAWWLRGVMAKRRGGLSKLCSNRAREELFRQLCSMVCNEATRLRGLFAPLSGSLLGCLFVYLIWSLVVPLGAHF